MLGLNSAYFRLSRVGENENDTNELRMSEVVLKTFTSVIYIGKRKINKINNNNIFNNIDNPYFKKFFNIIHLQYV